MPAEKKELISLVATDDLKARNEGKDNGQTETLVTNPVPERKKKKTLWEMLGGGRFANLDSLRGMGAMLIVLYHQGYPILVNAWFCISMFFTGSGFFITAITVEAYERKGFVHVTKFWANRIARLFPALILTIIAVLISQRFRVDDGITFQREIEDLRYAAAFATNYNLVYNNHDDYFDDFAQPSITRHMWTLSIEEQYYVVWPLMIFAITKIFGDNNVLNKNPNPELHPGLANPIARRALWALFIMDFSIVIFSYFSSLATIEALDLSAGYYSTWCRVGDIASGGMMYSLVRLIPDLSRRYLGDPNVEPMSMTLRVLNESSSIITVLVMIFVPMIQIPVNDMLLLYFKGWRLMMCLIGAMSFMGSLQLTEPLPRWAICSKLLTWPPLVATGIFSYGVYLFHWPMIIWFGDPKGQHQQKVALGIESYDIGESRMDYHVFNFILFWAALIIGFITFLYYEKPINMLSRKYQPWKTLAVGFSSMGMVFVLIWLASLLLNPVGTFENDSEEIFAGRPSDPRVTPLIHAINTDQDAGAKLYSDVLDYKTRTIKFPVKIYDDVLVEYSNFDKPTVNTTIVYCKTIANTHPCDDPNVWTEDTYWVWLESPQLCNWHLDLIPKFYPDFVQLSNKDFDRKCDNVLSIGEINVTDIVSDEHALTGMVMAIDDVFPGVLNQLTVWRATEFYNALVDGSFYEKQLNDVKWFPTTLTMIGESVAERIAMFWNDYIEVDMPDLNLEESSFPELEVISLAYPGKPAIAYFICLSDDPRYQYEHCLGFDSEKPGNVMESFQVTKPDVIAIHDAHWAGNSKPWNEESLQVNLMWLPTTFDKVLAFNIMLGEAVKNKAETMFYMTLSVDHNNQKQSDKYNAEKAILLQTVDSIGCSKDDPGSVRLTVLDWARLNCPSVGDPLVPCPMVHGFTEILPDGEHPSGDSGLWTTRIMLALLMEDVSQYSLPEEAGKFSSWDEAIANPITEQLLTLAEPDGNDTLKSLMTSYYICHQPDYGKLEETYNALPERMPQQSETYRDSKYATWPV